MAFPHLRIKTEEDHHVHLPHPTGMDATLCGLDASVSTGTPALGIDAPEETKAPISCPTCLIIIGACRGMALCELPDTRKSCRKRI